MNIEELWDLTTWVDKELTGKKLPDLFQSLAAALKHNSQPNQHRQPFEQQRTGLVTALRSIDLSTLTVEQVASLGTVELAPYLGPNGAALIENILTENALDIATAAAKIEEIANKVSTGIDRYRQIRSGLDVFVKKGAPAIDPSEALLRVTFSGDAQIANVVDFKKWADHWHTIGRGIAMAHGVAPESVRVVGASTGSIIVEMAVIVTVAKTASIVILECLKVADRVLDIQKKAQEIRALRLSNARIEQELQEEARKERQEGVNEISAKVSIIVGVKEGEDGDKMVALTSAIKTLVDFITKGGQVDCVLPKIAKGQEVDEATKTTREELQSTFKEIRVLEDRQRLLQHKQPK